MQVHAYRDLSDAIVVDEESLGKLWGYVDKFASGPVATVKCSDNISREFRTLADLLSFDNPTRSAMRRIEISGHSASQLRSIEITIGRPDSKPAGVSIRGEERDVSDINGKVCDCLCGMKAWYSRFATLDLFPLVMAVVLFGAITFSLMSPKGATANHGLSLKEALLALPTIFLLLGGVASAVYLFIYIRRRFFPVVSFAVGQGKKRHKFEDQMRWGVFVSLGVGVMGSAIYALLTLH